MVLDRKTAEGYAIRAAADLTYDTWFSSEAVLSKFGNTIEDLVSRSM
jgi:hypothetical protein